MSSTARRGGTGSSPSPTPGSATATSSGHDDLGRPPAMMRWIVASSLKVRRLVVAAAVGLMIVGIMQAGKTQVDVLPEFNPPMVEVQTEALGLSAEEVEQLITV